MITTKEMNVGDDSELVAQTLSGDRDAFGHIVTRYQSLVCSLTYSATGNLSQSEDLAQETFLTAWKQLAALREPSKLRSWLCGIARNVANNWLRRNGREPSHAAESLETIDNSAAPEPLPPDHTISNEEAAILWRSLERIPEIYREPLVLFYREHQSVGTVAQNLDLTEDTVKQRLSRGRKLLHEQVLSFVEGALERSNPGKAFTVAVLATLPALTISAKAATLGASAAAGGTTAKAAVTTGLFGALLGTVSGLVGTWLGYRMNMDAAQSDEEREYIKGFYRKLTWCLGSFFVVFIALMVSASSIMRVGGTSLFVTLVVGLAVAYTIGIVILSVWSFRQRKNFIRENSLTDLQKKFAKPVIEYRTSATLLGFPLIHIRIGGGIHAQRETVRAWIAVGDCAMGLLFAFGGFAVAPLSVGGCAIGVLAFGGSAFGLLSMGGISIGAWSFGGLALGWQAFGGCAIAWNAAMGGVAVARDFALGGLASAAQVNNSVAAEFIKPLPFFRFGEVAFRYLAALNLLWIIPMFYWWRAVAKRKAANAVQA